MNERTVMRASLPMTLSWGPTAMESQQTDAKIAGAEKVSRNIFLSLLFLAYSFKPQALFIDHKWSASFNTVIVVLVSYLWRGLAKVVFWNLSQPQNLFIGWISNSFRGTIEECIPLISHEWSSCSSDYPSKIKIKSMSVRLNSQISPLYLRCNGNLSYLWYCF